MKLVSKGLGDCDKMLEFKQHVVNYLIENNWIINSYCL